MRYIILSITISLLLSIYILSIIRVKYVLRHFISNFSTLMRKRRSGFSVKKRVNLLIKESDLNYENKHVKTLIRLEYAQIIVSILFFIFAFVSMYLFMER